MACWRLFVLALWRVAGIASGRPDRLSMLGMRGCTTGDVNGTETVEAERRAFVPPYGESMLNRDVEEVPRVVHHIREVLGV